MAPSSKKNYSQTNNFLFQYVNKNFLKSLLFDPAQMPIVTVVILLAELIINIIVVQRRPYTEIDWIAYMQECEGFLNGTTNYSLLKGDTGPLVYPAGFVYIYSIFYYITNHGQNIRLAQYCFIVIYLLQMYLVLTIYSKTRKVPPYVLIMSIFTSYRIHSIYMLRLFNDPIAILLLYAAINLYINSKWTMGSIFLSLAVSVKMNILLFAPAILLFFIVNLGYWNTFKQLSVCAIIQLILGAPFLLTHPIEYIKGSFDFGRIFLHKWTVNYRFLAPEIFEHKYFHVILLTIHVALLIVFAMPSYQYFQSYCRLRALQAQLQPQIEAKNREIDETKPNKKQRKSATKNSGEKKTDEISVNERIFLNSFEAMLKKASGISTAPQTMTQPPKSEKYEIHFDKAVQLAVLPMFLANFIGIACARSLHYQFYVWYFHSLPYLAWFTDYRTSFRLLLLGFIEIAWNVYPSTNWSSLLLHLCHIILLMGIGRKFFRSEQDAQNIKIQ